MLKPSYSELMDVLNANTDSVENEVTSRYSVVIAAAKRARQIIDGDEPMVIGKPGEKPLSIAVDELYENKIKIVPEGQGTVILKKEEKSLSDVEEDIKAELEDKLKDEEDDFEDTLEDTDEDFDDTAEDTLNDINEDDEEIEAIPEDDAPIDAVEGTEEESEE